MLNFISPLALWLGLSVIPILFFYFLRMRFKQQPVSSIFLWSRLQSVIGNASRIRWRTIILLLLQLITAIAAVAAVAQPLWTERYLSKPGVIYLLDISASMEATDVKVNAKYNSRLEQARALIIQDINKLSRKTEAAIFLCSAGIKPLGSPTTNHHQLITRLMATNDAAFWKKAGFLKEAAFSEADVASQLQAWIVTHKRSWHAVLVTDGGLDLAGKRLTGIFNGNLRAIIVGANGNNLGITALRILPGETENAHFLIHNGWPDERIINVIVEQNSRTIKTITLKIPPGTTNQTFSFPAPVSPGLYQVRIDQQADNLACDDRYYLAVNQPRQVRVLSVKNHTNPDNPFIKAALNNPAVNLTEITSFPSAGVNDGEWDLIIADRINIPRGLRCNILSFGVIPPEAPVQFSNSVKGPIQNVNSANSLQRFVDWTPSQVVSGYAFKVKPDIETLATVNEKPLIVSWEKEHRHYVIIGTDLFHSDLGISGAFPIFIQNLLQQCVPQWNNPLAYTFTVGETVALAEPVTWKMIDTNNIDINRQDALLFIKASAPGVFHWGQGVKRGILAANTSPGELDITPRPIQLDNNITGHTGAPTEKVLSSAQIFFGNWGLILLLFCLCLEWIVWRGLPKLHAFERSE